MRILSLLIGCVLIAFLAVACSDDDNGSTGATGSDGDTVRIGLLLPMSGALASYGEASQAALNMARDAINEDADLKVELVVKDTTTTPATALAMLEELHEEGIKVVIGPYASSEVTAAKPFADANGIILVSPLSTAGPLAVADHIYRFTPDEVKEGEAVAALALDDGIKTIIPVSRDDPGNLGLQNGMRAAYEPAGGTIAEGVTYDADEDDFQSVIEDIVAALAAAGSPPAETAIYLTAFEEVVEIMSIAATLSSNSLRSVTWYGSDSVALSGALIGNADAAGFAATVGYPNPILGLRDEDESMWQPVVEELESELDRRPDTFALAAYDALVVLHKAIVAAGISANVDTLGAAFVTAAESHVGLTGPAVLNDAGDRDSASFDFWAVCPEGNGFTWVRTISYAVAADGTGEIVRSEC